MPKTTPSPDPEKILDYLDKESKLLSKVTPDNCPFFSVSIVETNSKDGVNFAYCNIAQIQLGHALQFGTQPLNTPIEFPDAVIIWPKDIEDASFIHNAKRSSTHFFITKSGDICFKIRKIKLNYQEEVAFQHLSEEEEIWVLAESPSVSELEQTWLNVDGLAYPLAKIRDAVRLRNRAWNAQTPIELLNYNFRAFVQEPKEKRSPLPAFLPQPTFIEARQYAHALSDGRDGANWSEIQGAVALLHKPPKARHSIGTRFEPSQLLVKWLGENNTPRTLYDELARLEFDAIILFEVALSQILHADKARWSFSIDDAIKLIGRDKDARRSSESREEWRTKIWRWIAIFDSLAVVGARSGIWREPANSNGKREKISGEALYSVDPLIRVVGMDVTKQGLLEKNIPPKQISIVPGDWLMQFHGNREILSEMGNVLVIAQIPRGKPSGAWAACAALMLNQLWREEATRAKPTRTSRGGDSKIDVLQFRNFTRRELLAQTIRSEYDVFKILNDPKNRQDRVKEYWKNAIKELKERRIISFYQEMPITTSIDWRDSWLDQSMQIRPASETMDDVLSINKISHSKRRIKNTRKGMHKTGD